MKCFNRQVRNELFLLSSTSAVHHMQPHNVGFCWNRKMPWRNMTEIIATNSFCGVSGALWKWPFTIFSSGQVLLSPTKMAPNTPHATSRPHQKAKLLFDVPALLWVIIIWFDMFVDYHFTDNFFVLLFPGLYLFQELVWLQATIG